MPSVLDIMRPLLCVTGSKQVELDCEYDVSTRLELVSHEQLALHTKR